MIRLDIQKFGGRGASSSVGGGIASKDVRKTWKGKNERMANVMSQLGITYQQYQENVSVGNRLYMGVINEISNQFEAKTGLREFARTKEFSNFVNNFDVSNYVKNNSISKEYLSRLRKGR